MCCIYELRLTFLLFSGMCLCSPKILQGGIMSVRLQEKKGWINRLIYRDLFVCFVQINIYVRMIV